MHWHCRKPGALEPARLRPMPLHGEPASQDKTTGSTAPPMRRLRASILSGTWRFLTKVQDSLPHGGRFLCRRQKDAERKDWSQRRKQNSSYCLRSVGASQMPPS